MNCPNCKSSRTIATRASTGLDEFRCQECNYLFPSTDSFGAQYRAAVKTLPHLGYSYNGGDLWKPPLGKLLNFDLMDAVHAKNAELQAHVGKMERQRFNLVRLLRDWNICHRYACRADAALGPPCERKHFEGCVSCLLEWSAQEGEK